MIKSLLCMLITLSAFSLLIADEDCADCGTKSTPLVNQNVVKEKAKLKPLKHIISDCEENIEQELVPTTESNTGLKVKSGRYYAKKPKEHERVIDGKFRHSYNFIDSTKESLTRTNTVDDTTREVPKNSQLGRYKESDLEKMSKRSFRAQDSQIRVTSLKRKSIIPSTERIGGQGKHSRYVEQQVMRTQNPTKDKKPGLKNAYRISDDSDLGRAYPESKLNDQESNPGSSKIIKRVKKDDPVQNLPKEKKHYLYCR